MRAELDFWGRLDRRAENHLQAEAGWHNSESFVQTELKRPGDVPKEIRDMVNAMQVNALRREQMLVQHFERKLAAQAAPE